MRRTLLASASLFLFLACPAVRADSPGPDCCSTHPVYLCQPGFMGYPAPPHDLASYDDCGGCHRGCGRVAVGCGMILPNAYSCCFYGVTLSNYGLITPLHTATSGIPARLPVLPTTPREPEKVRVPEPR
jgi:hypothetical protein